jgi:hypothetical protein
MYIREPEEVAPCDALAWMLKGAMVLQLAWDPGSKPQ